MYITLDEAKQHLNLIDFNLDDEYILQLINVAEQAVLVHVNEDPEILVEKNGGCLPAPIQQAMLLLIGEMYRNREPVGTKEKELPLSYVYLINLYQNYNN